MNKSPSIIPLTEIQSHRTKCYHKMGYDLCRPIVEEWSECEEVCAIRYDFKKAQQDLSQDKIECAKHTSNHQEYLDCKHKSLRVFLQVQTNVDNCSYECRSRFIKAVDAAIVDGAVNNIKD